MKNKTLKLRKEAFGGTLFSVSTGKRAYITSSEFNMIVGLKPGSRKFLQELAMEGKLVVTHPEYLPDNNFSSPDTVFFEVTRACNLRCTHCFNGSGVRLGDELSIDERKAVIADLAHSGVQEIRFTGGEPTLLPELMDLMMQAREAGMRISMGTNGIVMHREKAREIGGILNLAVISLDGTKYTHDKIRGKGSFDKTMEGIRFYQELGVDIRINTVLMRSNMEDMLLLVQYLHDQNLAVFVRRLIPAGRANGMSPDMLSREEYAMFEKLVTHLLDDPRGLIKGHYLREGNEPLSRIELPFQRHGCSAGHRGLVVLPNGKVQTCGFLGPLGERSVGILPSEKLSVVWRRLIASKHIESLRALLPNHNAKGCGPCTNCLAIALAHETSEEH